MTDTKPYQTLKSRVLIQNPWYQLRQDDIILPNGEQTVYNVINKANAVWVVPYLADGRVVLINQYRYAIDAWCVELPAGGIAAELEPHAVAHQELREEVGGYTDDLLFLGQYWTMNGIGDELGYFYLARNVRLGPPQHEATEVIQRLIVPWNEALAMAREGRLADAPSALALFLAEPYLSS